MVPGRERRGDSRRDDEVYAVDASFRVHFLTSINRSVVDDETCAEFDYFKITQKYQVGLDLI